MGPGAPGIDLAQDDVAAAQAFGVGLGVNRDNSGRDPVLSIQLIVRVHNGHGFPMDTVC